MRKPYKVALFTVVGAWALLMLVLSPQFLALHRETKSVLETFDRYSAALVSERFNEAYGQCGTEFHDALSYEQFVSMQRSFQTQFGSLSSVSRTAFELHEKGTPPQWRAVIDADLSYERKRLRFEFVFRKE